MLKRRIVSLLALATLVLMACAPAAPSPTPAPAPTQAPAVQPTAAPAAAAKPAKLDKFIYGIPAYHPLHTVMMVAMDKKLFEKYGIDLDVPLTQSGPAAAAALAGGSLDATVVAPDAGFPLQAQNPDVKMIMAVTESSPYVLVTRTEINSIADLKGKTLGSSAVKTGADTVALRAMMLKNGLVDEKDYTIVVVGAVPERVEAMKSGNLAGVPQIEPQVSELKSRGFKVLDDAFKYPELKGIYSAVVIAKQSKYKANEDVFVRFMKGYIEASKFVNDPANKSEVIRVLATTLKITNEYASNTYERFVPNKVYPVMPRIGTEQITQNVKLSKTLQVPGVPDDPAPYVDNSLMDKAAK